MGRENIENIRKMNFPSFFLRKICKDSQTILVYSSLLTKVYEKLSRNYYKLYCKNFFGIRNFTKISEIFREKWQIYENAYGILGKLLAYY